MDDLPRVFFGILGGCLSMEGSPDHSCHSYSVLETLLQKKRWILRDSYDFFAI